MTAASRRILLKLEYDGTDYAGWQFQTNGVSVQQRLEEGLAKITGVPVRVTGSSRTDAGVHARCQMAHFDTFSAIPPERYPFALNNVLPEDIRVLEGRQVPDTFHARFLSSGKTYTYRILNSRHGSALLRRFWWHVPVPLAHEPMLRAVRTLEGTHDFAAFQAAGGTAKSTLRTMDSASLSLDGDQIVFRVSGNAFLYNMVRIMAGTLVEIGLGRLAPDAFSRAYASLSRLDLGMTAPPHGLELTEVRYPPEAFLAPEPWYTPEK